MRIKNSKEALPDVFKNLRCQHNKVAYSMILKDYRNFKYLILFPAIIDSKIYSYGFIHKLFKFVNIFNNFGFWTWLISN